MKKLFKKSTDFLIASIMKIACNTQLASVGKALAAHSVPGGSFVNNKQGGRKMRKISDRLLRKWRAEALQKIAAFDAMGWPTNKPEYQYPQRILVLTQVLMDIRLLRKSCKQSSSGSINEQKEDKS